MSNYFSILQDGSPVDTIEFDPLSIGDELTEEITIRKETDGVLVVKEIDLDVSGPGYLTIDEQPEKLDEKDSGEIVMTVRAINSEPIKPIKATLEITAEVTVYP